MNEQTTITPQQVLPVSEQLLHSTIRIECEGRNGNGSSGTGFHYRFPLGDEWVPSIITNKHVLDGASKIGFVLTMTDGNGRPAHHERYGIFELGEAWIPHPDPVVDLALLPIQPLLSELEKLGKRPFYIDLAPSVIPDDRGFSRLGPVEEIVMIRYPNGLWDEENNKPIVRRGITATACNKNYRSRSEFLIDAAVFPGSSGSPVFIFNQGVYSDGTNIQIGGRLLFIGILYAVHLHTAQGQITTIVAPTTSRQMALSQIPNNLGICIRASRIAEFEPAIRARIAAQARRSKAL